MYLNRSELKENNYEKGDTEGIVNYGLSLKNIEFTAMFIEDLDKEKTLKILPIETLKKFAIDLS